MRKQIAICAAIAAVAIISSSRAQESTGAEPLRLGQQQHIDAVKIQQPAFADFRMSADRSREILAEIVDWLAANLDLPAIYEPPPVEFVSSAKITHMRYGAFLPDSPRQILVSDSVGQAAHQRETVAIYNNATRTIFLPDTWSGRTPAELSVLVHEMVHHLQNVGQLKYDCPAAREKPAYLAQNRWLRQFGLDLENEFQIDMFTIVAMSACMN
jgi:hypothetical protein